MPAALIIQLLTTFGPSAINLVNQLISMVESNANVTSAQWATLIAEIQGSNATTEMAKQLAAAGINSTDPRYIALIAATKA